MTIGNRYTIAFKGLKNGLHDYEFTVGGELFAAEECTDIKGGECRAEVRVRKSETMLDAEVSISGYVIVECDRCLEDCRIPVESESRLTVKVSEAVDECEYDGETMLVPAALGEVDLSHYIYESIVLALPYRRVHAEGECDPEMLAHIGFEEDN